MDRHVSFGHNNSPRPLWIAQKSESYFEHYMAFLEMHGHRYVAPSLALSHYVRHEMDFLHIPTQGAVAIGQHTYFTTDFQLHVYPQPTPRSHTELGYDGIIYLTIKDSKRYYYAYLEPE